MCTNVYAGSYYIENYTHRFNNTVIKNVPFLVCNMLLYNIIFIKSVNNGYVTYRITCEKYFQQILQTFIYSRNLYFNFYMVRTMHSITCPYMNWSTFLLYVILSWFELCELHTFMCIPERCQPLFFPEY